jgi:zinc/manganese transport system substrate-binding protein
MKYVFSLYATLLLALTVGSLRAEEPLEVVASFSILGDIAKEIGGDQISLTVLVGRNSDTHVYRAKPQDAQLLNKADVLLTNGLGFEGWIDRLAQSSGFQGQLIVASHNLPFVISSEHGGHDDHAGHDDHENESGIDPHAWHNIENAKQYARNIALGFIEKAPNQKTYFEQRLSRYLNILEELNLELNTLVSSVSENQRRVVTSHDAFGYLAQKYQLQFIAPLSVSTESEASAKDIALLIRQIKEHGIQAIFVENVSDARLISQVARETNATIGGELYADSLSELGGDAESYVSLMRHNMNTIVEALR